MAAIAIDISARCVLRDGREIHLPPKTFDLLVMLAAAAPNAVTHEQLHAALWPGVHVSDPSRCASR